MTRKELEALMTVRDKLRSGEIPPERFDMEHWRGPCGCIGWHMVQMTGSFGGDLWELFFPQDTDDAYSATPRQAAQAIDNFLETGDPKWREVMTNDV